jgi:hypothetical protein
MMCTNKFEILILNSINGPSKSSSTSLDIFSVKLMNDKHQTNESGLFINLKFKRCHKHALCHLHTRQVYRWKVGLTWLFLNTTCIQNDTCTDFLNCCKAYLTAGGYDQPEKPFCWIGGLERVRHAALWRCTIEQIWKTYTFWKEPNTKNLVLSECEWSVQRKDELLVSLVEICNQNSNTGKVAKKTYKRGVLIGCLNMPLSKKLI